MKNQPMVTSKKPRFSENVYSTPPVLSSLHIRHTVLCGGFPRIRRALPISLFKPVFRGAPMQQ